MNTLALNAQSPQPTATAESNNVAASDTTSSSDSSPVDTFLTLFVAEIQNQDPTDPTDATEYIDQLSVNGAGGDDGRDERAGEYQRGVDEQHSGDGARQPGGRRHYGADHRLAGE
ncbi:flagellar hook capping protein [Escherichia coli]|uniref:Basal-body rod modification protein FlgD n=1 Tax=Escherichia coli TaxID=562 RepID=A0A376LIB9_ECOLX|nr:flagellar hook capping protein [Escherichia coli]